MLLSTSAATLEPMQSGSGPAQAWTCISSGLFRAATVPPQPVQLVELCAPSLHDEVLIAEE
jgi:hypothetical protein